MSIYSQSVNLPIIFHIERGALNNLTQIIESKNFNFKKILAITGKSYSHTLLKNSNLDYFKCHTVSDNSYNEVEYMADFLNGNDFDLIIALGGGKVIDFGKRVSYLTNVNLIVVPTIVSNDGLMSPISVILNEKGLTESLPGAMPLGIIIDTEILYNAPEKYFIAAAGDILSNVSATNDWLISNQCTNEKINDLGFHLSRMSAFATICYNNINFCDIGFKRLIVECQLNSGIAMSLSGSSRPCSGSEHLISHTLDFLNYDKETLHGYKVGCLSLFCLFLQNKLTKEIYDFTKKINLDPYYILDVLKYLKSKSPEVDVMVLFRSMRKNRYTVLNQINGADIYALAVDYVSQISEYENQMI